jgi:hypothetical protein
MKSTILGLIGLTCLAASAQSQTINAFDADNIVVPYGTNTVNDFSAPITFTVSASGESLYIQGTAVSSPYISGIGSLVDTTSNSVIFDSVPLTDGGVTNPLFTTANLAAGNYTFLYSFSDSSAALPDTVSIEATLTSMPVVSAPEIDPTAATTGLCLLVGGLVVARGARRRVPSIA